MVRQPAQQINIRTCIDYTMYLIHINFRAERRGKQSWCIIVLRGYVRMYVYLQIAQCNSMLVYVYPQCLCNTILCSCMYVRHVCTTIVQFSGQNVPRGWFRPQTTAWPACVACILWKNTTTSISSLCPAHCISHTISVTLWKHTLMFAECIALWTITLDSGVV